MVDRSYTHGGGDRFMDSYDVRKLREFILAQFCKHDRRQPKKRQFPRDYSVALWTRRLPDQWCGMNPKGTCWFVGDNLYSYRTMIGRFVRASDGTIHALLAAGPYSKTTKGQLWTAECALRKLGFTIHTVEDVEDCFASMRQFRTEYEEARADMGNTSKRVGTRLAAGEKAVRIWQAAKAFSEAGNVVFTLGELPDGMRTEIDALRALYHAKLNAAAERAEARKLLSGATLKAYIRQIDKAASGESHAG